MKVIHLIYVLKKTDIYSMISYTVATKSCGRKLTHTHTFTVF